MKALVSLGIVAALTAMQAQAACLAPDDARTLFTVALPGAIDGLTRRCSSVLGDDAFLLNRGAALAARYRREAPVDPARARHAIEVASGQDTSFLADDSTVTKLADDYVEHTIETKVKTRDCAMIDGLVALAAPLRADDMAEAVMLALQLAGPDLAIGQVSICRRSSEVAGR